MGKNRTMTGQELVDWIKEKDMLDKNVYFVAPMTQIVTGVKEENLTIDECDDLLICVK